MRLGLRVPHNDCCIIALRSVMSRLQSAEMRQRWAEQQRSGNHRMRAPQAYRMRRRADLR